MPGDKVERVNALLIDGGAIQVLPLLLVAVLIEVIESADVLQSLGAADQLEFLRPLVLLRFGVDLQAARIAEGLGEVRGVVIVVVAITGDRLERQLVVDLITGREVVPIHLGLGVRQVIRELLAAGGRARLLQAIGKAVGDRTKPASREPPVGPPYWKYGADDVISE